VSQDRLGRRDRKVLRVSKDRPALRARWVRLGRPDQLDRKAKRALRDQLARKALKANEVTLALLEK
jgi:hypothetical protein